MKLSKDDLRNYSILGVFFLAIAIYAYTQLSTPDVPPAPVQPVATASSAAAKPQTTAARPSSARPALSAEAQLDPTLHMEAMLVTESLVYSGSGRNIFSADSTPTLLASLPRPVVHIPEPIAPVRTGPTVAAGPPPIDLKFFGTESNAAQGRRAFLLHGDDVFLVASGDIVQRRYRVISIDARSIVMEDIANSNRQTLPLLAN